jgi:hypothetical protein
LKRHLNILLLSTIFTATAATMALQVHAQQGHEKISKELLINLSREQSNVLCESSVFTSCMGFDKEACFDLSEEAVQQCLAPLPDTIKLAELQNESLESCPQEVYAKAGYTDEKAQACLQKALSK